MACIAWGATADAGDASTGYTVEKEALLSALYEADIAAHATQGAAETANSDASRA